MQTTAKYPFTVHWTDGTWAIVNWADVPVDVRRSFRWGQPPLGLRFMNPKLSEWYKNHNRETGNFSRASRQRPVSGTYATLVLLEDMLRGFTPPDADVHVQTTPTEWVRPALYDGATAEQCLARYKWLQRADVRPDTSYIVVGAGCPDLQELGLRPGDKVALTEAQKMVAQDLWRKELQTKTAESKTKEQNLVGVDREFEEWE